MKIHHILLLAIILFSHSLKLPAESYKRIISLAQSVTNNIYLLGAQDKLIGCTKYCTIAQKDHIDVVADALTVNIEKVVSLQPDLVIASGLTPPRILSAIEKMNIPTLQLQQPQNFDELCKQLEKLGELCDKSETARQYIQQSRKRLACLPQPAKEKTIFMELGSNPLFTVLPESFMNDYITFLGAQNIFHQLTTGTISKEAVLLKNPDIIIVVSMNGTGAQEIEAWKKYPTLKAVSNHQLFLIDANEACTPTPVSFVNLLETLAQQLMR